MTHHRWIYLADPDRLIATRLAHAYTRARLARRIRVHPSFLKYLESGKRTALSPEIAHRLVWAFGTTIEGAMRQGFYTLERPEWDTHGKHYQLGRRYRQKWRRRINDLSPTLRPKKPQGGRGRPRKDSGEQAGGDAEVVGSQSDGPEPPP